MTSPPHDRPAEGTGTEEPARPAWFTDVDDLRAATDRVKKLFEERRWPEAAALLALDQVWAFDRPLPIAAAVAAVAAAFDRAVDVHLWVEKILRAEAADGAGHLTLNCCLMWGEEGNLADREHELDLHLGFGRDAGGGWSFRYLGVTPGTPETIPFPQEARAELPAISAGTPVAVDASGAPLAAPPGQVIAYVPVYVPASALQSAATLLPPLPAPLRTAAEPGPAEPAAAATGETR